MVEDSILDDLWTRRYNFCGRDITIQEDFAGESGLGGSIFQGSVLLAKVLEDESVFPAETMEGKRFIELGAGCGLAGLVPAMRGAYVTFTDAEGIEHLEENVQSNLNDDEWARCSACELVWGETDYAPFMTPSAPDYIIAAECIYDPALIDPLLRAAWELSDDSTEFIMTGVVGDHTLKRFERRVLDYFTVEAVGNMTAYGHKKDTLSWARAVLRMKKKPEIAEEVVDEEEEEKEAVEEEEKAGEEEEGKSEE
eukprot:PLAT2995.1.p1 GENE.PLAT2995.1~~PLAT2995.1.p1  ORF type:complete len:261 (+),score=85.81 PLAT2995.1:26-784(+)